MEHSPIAQDAQPHSTEAPSLEADNRKLFRTLKKKFVSDDDDARGFLALGLFLSELIDSEENASSQAIIEKIASADPSNISIIYYAAAHRLLENFSDETITKSIDAQIKNERLYALLSQQFELKADSINGIMENRFSQVDNAIANLAKTQTPFRQTAVSAMAAVLVALLASIIVFGPDIFGTLRILFQPTH